MEAAVVAGARQLLGASGTFNPPPAPNQSLEDRVTALEMSFASTGTGDSAWMLTSTSIVLMMTIPGLAMFYGGMVQPKNYLHTVMQSFITCCLVTCIWMIFGYSLAFTEGSPVIGGKDRFFLFGMTPSSVHPLAPAIPESLFMMFQMTFAIITPALICGGLAERMRFDAFIIFISAWSLIVYCPVAHSVWAVDGFLSKAQVLDFAGGDVVHINSGVAALVCAIVLGKRHGHGKHGFEPHNVSTSLIGASLLWVGWFGFNAGSTLGASANAGYTMAVTQIATGAAALSWMFTEWLVKGRPTVLSVISGAVAGLVVITPACGFVSCMGGIVMGFIGGIFCFFTVQLKHRLGYDDALDAFGVHGSGGILGGILTGLFADPKVNGKAGAFYGNGIQVARQLYGITVTIGYSATMTYVLLKLIDRVVPIRVHLREEVEGLDVSVHGESIYYGNLGDPSQARSGGALLDTMDESQDPESRGEQLLASGKAAAAGANGGANTVHPVPEEDEETGAAKSNGNGKA